MFTSTLPAINIPQSNLLEFIFAEHASDKDLHKPIFIDSDNIENSHSFSSLKAAASDFGAALRNIFNFEQGDVVAVFSPNSIDYPVAIFGTFFAGGTVTLVNPIYKKDEVASQLRNSRAAIIFTTAELFDVAEEAAALAGIDRCKIIVAGPKPSGCMHTLDELLNQTTGLVACQALLQQLAPEQTAFLCYSSGTTGLPKAVQLSHKNVIANLLQWDGAETRLDQTSSLIAVLPFSHIYALSVLIMNPLRRSMSSYVMKRFVPKQFMQLIERHKITASFIVPPIIKVLLSEEAKQYDLSSLTFLCSGAAPLSALMARQLCETYHLPISQGYGMTETSPVLCYSSFDGLNYTGSIGKLLPGIMLRIVDDQGTSLPSGKTGELQVKGPNVMAGYLKNDQANAEAFTLDGYFRTGDLGYMSPDGYVFVVDRLKELIKYKGFQVPPVELENLLLAHPAIQDCAVVGRSCDIEVTELPTAYCVLKPHASTRPDALPLGWTDIDCGADEVVAWQQDLARDIMQFIAAKVANFKKLRGGVVFVDSIPRLPAGKILRRLLRDRTGVHFILE